MSGGRRTGRSGALGAFTLTAVVFGGAALGCDETTEDPPAADAGPMAGDSGRIDARPAPEPGADAAAGWIELGTGSRTFESLEPGEEVPIIQGIQGGFHVWGGFRGGGFDDDDVRLRFWLDLDGETIARADYSEFGLPPDRRDPGVYDYAGVAVVYDENSRVQLTSGRPMTLRVEVESFIDGQVMGDSIEVIPICCE